MTAARNRYPGVYKRGNSWSYRAQFGDGDARHGISGSGYPSAKAANDAKVEAIRNARPLNGVTQRPDATLTLAGYLEAWVADHTLTMRPSTAHAYRSRLGMVAKSPVAEKRLRSLTEQDYRRLVRDLRDQSPSHTNVRLKVGTLSQALDAAVRAGLIPHHPVRLITVSRTGERFEPGVWEVAQVTKFLAERKAAGDPLFLCWHLALVTGMRRGELHGLRREDINLEGGVLHVRRQRVVVGGKMVEGPVKTEGSEAPVYLDPATIELLRDHVWTSDYLVNDPSNGRPFEDMRKFDRAFKTACRRAGVPVLRFHDLRHTSASILADLGVPLVLAQQRLRHWSSAMTQRYTHALDARGAEVAAQIGALVAGA